MVTVACRPADAADLPRIRSVVSAAYEKYLARTDKPPAPLERDYEEAVVQRLVWVTGDPVVGLVVLVETDGALLIENVAVHPSAQGRGVGRGLMDCAETRAAERGIGRLTLYTNEVMTENVPLYEHLGYTEVGRRIDDGYRRIFMEKDVLLAPQDETGGRPSRQHGWGGR
jgi:ribosomal protein S18 acetylase RimI-like enzyme